MPKITKRFVEAIQPDSKKTLIYWDSELKGFGIVVLPSGRKTYCIQYRNLNKIKKRFKIGVHGHLTTEEARSLAKKQLSNVVQGEDLAENMKQYKASASLEDLAQYYIQNHGVKKRPKSLYEDQKILKNFILPKLSSFKIQNIQRLELEKLHLNLKATPYQANRMLALLSKMFSLAMAWGWVNDNPTKGIQKYPEEKRDRWLDNEELERFWKVLDSYPNHPTSYVFKLLLLTGARKGEVLQATWDQFDLEKGIWTKPAHLTKQNKKEYLPLSLETLEILKKLKERNSKKSIHLFPGRVDHQPLKEVKTFWKRVLKEAKIDNVRIHDLRHTHASHLVSSGLSLSIVGKLLGHTQASTTQRYAHLADDSLRQATGLFGRKIAGYTPVQ